MKTENKKPAISLDSIEPLIQKISDLTKMQRILLCVLLVALIVGGFVYFLYMPNFEQISKLQKEIAEEEIKLKENKKNADQYAEFQKKLEEAQVKFNIAAKALPVKNEVPSLLTSISQLGTDVGLEFLLFRPEAEVVKDFYAELPITMQLSGTYHDLGAFFDQLAGMSRIVNINRFEMNRSGKPDETELVISCAAQTYKFIEFVPEVKKENARGK